jgi:lysophospholipase L1-like esterase
MSQGTFAQKISAIGSSTVSGEGAIPRDSSWVNLHTLYLTGLGLPVTTLNLGWSGTTSFNGLPSSLGTGGHAWPFPPGDEPFLGQNVTAALSINPVVVFIAYPSNDLVLGKTMTEYLRNLRIIYDSVRAAGKIAYVATSQPRNDVGPAIRALQVVAKDSILAEFPGFTFNFWDPLADPVTLGFKTGLTDDGIHPNNKGHQLLFQVVKNTNVLSIAPLPLKLNDLRAIYRNQQIHLSWNISNLDAMAAFWIQRSRDGNLFEDRHQLSAAENTTTTDYSWTDESPLPGKSFYRIKIAEQGATTYSKVISIFTTADEWKIGKLYAVSGSLWNLEILSGKEGTVKFHLVDGSGRSLLQQSLYVNAPSTIFPVDLSGLANGAYFLQLSTPDGGRLTRAIQKR